MQESVSICFRGQANEVVAESKADRLDPQIRQIGLRNRSISLEFKLIYLCPRDERDEEKEVTPSLSLFQRKRDGGVRAICYQGLEGIPLCYIVVLVVPLLLTIPQSYCTLPLLRYVYICMCNVCDS